MNSLMYATFIPIENIIFFFGKLGININFRNCRLYRPHPNTFPLKSQIIRKSLFISIVLFQVVLKSFAQKETSNQVSNKQKFGVEFKSYGLGVGGTKQGRGREGFNIFYS